MKPFQLVSPVTFAVRLQTWLGFWIGLAAGAAIAAVWVATAELVPAVESGQTFGHGIGIRALVYGFIVAGLVWGALWRTEAGLTWAVGLALGIAIPVGVIAGLDATNAWGLDWEFGERPYLRPQDLQSVRWGGAAVSASLWMVSVGSIALFGSWLMSLLGAYAVRPAARAAARLAVEVALTLAPDGVVIPLGRGRRLGRRRQVPMDRPPPGETLPRRRR